MRLTDEIPSALEALEASLLAGDLVLFFGSAVSMFPPCMMPPGAMVTHVVKGELQKRALASGGRSGERLAIAWQDLSFESILALNPSLDADGNRETVVGFLRRLYGRRAYNTIHRTVAAALVSNLVTSAVTTNYDTCIEAASGDLEPSSLLVVHSATQEHPSRSSRRVLFKIHGSIDKQPDGLVFSLYQEGRGLPEWKARLLLDLLTDKDVFFFGYSGYDFDICPFLLEHRGCVRTIFWSLNVPALTATWDDVGDRISSDGVELLRAHPHHLLGDFRRVWSALCKRVSGLESVVGEVVEQEQEPQEPEGVKGDLMRATVEAFRASFQDEEENRLWNVSAHCRVGAGEEACRLASQLRERWARPQTKPVRPSLEVELTKRLGEAEFMVGRYRSAERHFAHAAARAQDLGLPLTRVIDFRLSVLEAARCRLNPVNYVLALLRWCLPSGVRLAAAKQRIERDAYLRTQAKILERLGQALAEMGRWAHSLTRGIGQDRQRPPSGLFQRWAQALYGLALKRVRDVGDEFSARDLEYRMGHAEVLQRYRRIGYAVGRVNSLRETARMESDPIKALGLIEDSVSLAEALGDWPGVAKGRYIQSELLLNVGADEEGLYAYEAALAALRHLEVGRPLWVPKRFLLRLLAGR